MSFSTKVAGANSGSPLANAFRLGSSKVDWCEPNYVVSEIIAEFWNTVSNIFFFLVPPLMIILFRSYSKRVGNGIFILWILLIVIGIGSAYFHGTLTLAGQLLDEISILWIIIAGYALFLPSVYLPQSLRVQRLCYICGLNNRLQQHRFVYICIVIAIIITSLSVIYPYANAFALFVLGLPSIGFLAVHLARCDNRRIKDLGIRCLGMWGVAVTIWICDRIFCPFWLSISFPYLHSFWHILILFSGNIAIVVCAYLVIKQQQPQANLHLHTWPNEHWDWLGLPYISFHDGAGDDDGFFSSSSSSNNYASKSIV